MSNNSTAHSYEYKAEMKQLLHLLIHSLYTHPEVFLRELISNASDAMNKVRFRELTDEKILDAGKALELKINVDKDKHTFSLSDAGIGMTEDELVNNIGTVARSGTLEYLKKMQESGESVEEGLIGQFGVGFYSVFMVTDEVTIETRSADPDSKGYRWQSNGEGSFTIEEIDKKERGTTISFTLKESAQEFSQEWKIKEVIEKYSNFADFPIFLGEEKVNSVNALWLKKSDDVSEEELKEFYKFVSNNFDDPLGHLHLALEGAAVNFKALLFVPNSAPYDLFRAVENKGLHLYCNKILIQRDCKELVPDYLRFLRGVVDTIDLPLNVSREVTQSSPVMEKIRNIIVKKVLGLLKEWADTDQEKYKSFYSNFGKLLATGLNSDFANRDKITDLLRYESSTSAKGELVSLKDYVTRMKGDQKEIYYLSGDSREELESNPNLEYFRKHDIEVLLLSDPADVFTFPSVHEYEKKPIKSIDKADIDLKPDEKIEKPDNKLTKNLLGIFKEVLGERVEDVVESKRLVDSSVTLVAGKNSMDPQMEKMMRMMNKGHVPSKKILEVNMSHPVISNLSRMYLANSADPMIKKCVEQLYNGALLIDGELSMTADFVKRMNEIMIEATK